MPHLISRLQVLPSPGLRHDVQALRCIPCEHHLLGPAWQAAKAGPWQPLRSAICMSSTAHHSTCMEAERYNMHMATGQIALTLRKKGGNGHQRKRTAHTCGMYAYKSYATRLPPGVIELGDLLAGALVVLGGVLAEVVLHTLVDVAA
jgi:hypothetical protein